MKIVAFLAVFAGCFVSLSGQTYLWITFTDKGAATENQLLEPDQFLSSEAIARRQLHGIEVTSSDLPVVADYVSQVLNLNTRKKMTSKWMNGMLVEGNMASIPQLQKLPFVKSVDLIGQSFGGITAVEFSTEGEMNYGQASTQLEMLNLPPFHAKGFMGQGMRMAILDAGFPGADTLAVFDSLRNRGGILATYDFVEDTTWAYHASAHGTKVLSTIASYLPGKVVGTAPMVDVMLFRTEDARRELQIEEFYWLAAVEMADSLGVDIIHSSLGYNHFQDSPGYEYEDLDGDKAIVTKAADWAASKGILVITSAGNEGNKSWKYITAPCDGDSILCVGSVTRWYDRSGFSSIGPSADGRIKPDVVAMGTAATTVGPTPRVQLSNGTSFAAPMVAGFAACVWQANRQKSNMQMIDAIRLSSDQAGLPDSDYGYGIPNAIQADSLLRTGQDLSSLTIVQARKPARGRAALEAARTATPPEEAEAMDWNWEAYSILLTLPSPDLQVRRIVVKRGDEFVTTHPDAIRRVGDKVRIDTERWLPGTYQVTVEAIGYKETISVEVPRA